MASLVIQRDLQGRDTSNRRKGEGILWDRTLTEREHSMKKPRGRKEDYLCLENAEPGNGGRAEWSSQCQPGGHLMACVDTGF